MEGCVKEMLQTLSISVHSRRNVEFVFSGIGKLTIRDLKAKMTFHKEFIQELDKSGHLLASMQLVSGDLLLGCFAVSLVRNLQFVFVFILMMYED